MKKMNLAHEGGMTLVETVVAVTVLVFAITGPMVLAYQSIRATRDVRNELTATHLASEAIEIIHNIRANNSTDDTTTSGTNWLNNISCSTGCIVDVTQQSNPNVWNNNALRACTSCDNITSTQSRLYYNPTSGQYIQRNGGMPNGYELSPFRRVVRVVNTAGTPIATVTATVYYRRNNGTEGNVTLVEEIYNWFPQTTP